MFGVGFLELCIIAIFALIFIGPKKLPDFMRQLGQLLIQARRISNEVKFNIETALQEEDTPEKKQQAKGPSIPVVVPTPDEVESALPPPPVRSPEKRGFEHLST